MDRLWKHLMQLDAKALFFGSVALFVVVVAIVAALALRNHASPAAQPQKMADSAVSSVCSNIGVLDIVSNQMSANTLVVPVNPFRPGIENMGAGTHTDSRTNRTHKSARTNLFAGLRPSENNEPGTPTFTFRGYFQRPDGTAAALFFDSTDNAGHFFTPGDKLRDATLVSANIHVAKVRKPDGQTVELAIGDSVTLPAATP
jgi:hypothetical protein